MLCVLPLSSLLPVLAINALATPEPFSLNDVLFNWPPWEHAVPSEWQPTLQSFQFTTWQGLQSMALGGAPYIVKSVPHLRELNELWDDTYLSRQLKDIRLQVDSFQGPVFRYGDPRNVKNASDIATWLKFWRSAASSTTNATYQYLQLTSTEFPWLKHDAALFADIYARYPDSRYPFPEPVVIPQPASASGDGRATTLQASAKDTQVICRFAPPGLIAEAHFDTYSNYLGVVRGRRRYVLSPPSLAACASLAVSKEPRTRRHSTLDWSDPGAWQSLQGVPALEGVLEAGDVLFVPPFWYHYIVTLDEPTLQCNRMSPTYDLPLDVVKCLADEREVVTTLPAKDDTGAERCEVVRAGCRPTLVQQGRSMPAVSGCLRRLSAACCADCKPGFDFLGSVVTAAKPASLARPNQQRLYLPAGSSAELITVLTSVSEGCLALLHDVAQKVQLGCPAGAQCGVTAFPPAATLATPWDLALFFNETALLFTARPQHVSRTATPVKAVAIQLQLDEAGARSIVTTYELRSTAPTQLYERLILMAKRHPLVSVALLMLVPSFAIAVTYYTRQRNARSRGSLSRAQRRSPSNEDKID